MRCGCSCARCAGCPRRWTGARRSSPPPGRGRARCAPPALRDRVTVLDDRRGRRGGAARLGRRHRRRLGRPGARAGAARARARAPGAVPVAARLPAYEEVLRDGERGLLFEPGDVDTLCAQLVRLIEDAGLRERLCARPRRVARLGRASRRAFEAIYGAVAARRHRRARTSRAGARREADRRRPAHAHGPLERLRDAGRRAARHRARAGARRDRGHRPQRGLGRARRRAPRPRSTASR